LSYCSYSIDCAISNPDSLDNTNRVQALFDKFGSGRYCLRSKLNVTELNPPPDTEIVFWPGAGFNGIDASVPVITAPDGLLKLRNPTISGGFHNLLAEHGKVFVDCGMFSGADNHNIHIAGISDVTIDGAEVFGAGNRGILTNHESTFCINNTVARDNANVGITHAGTNSSGTVSKSKAFGNGGHGFLMTSAVRGVSWLDNESNDNADTNNNAAGFVVGRTTQLDAAPTQWRIEGNKAARNQTNGFSIDPKRANNDFRYKMSGTFNSNQSRENGTHGFNFTHADGITGSNNIAMLNGNSGKAISNSSHITLLATLACDNAQRGIALFGSDPGIGDIDVRGYQSYSNPIDYQNNSTHTNVVT